MVIHNKNVIRLFLILSFMAVNSLLIFGISAIFNFLNTGADRDKMLHTEVHKVEQYIPTVTWFELKNEGREMDKQTLKEVEKNYLDAWYVKHIAYQTNLIAGIEDYYTDSAEKNLFSVIAQNKKENIHIEATTLNHHPNLDFFSEDGQLIVLTDHNVQEYKRIYKDDQLIHETTEIVTYKVILLLEDGFWRIRHMVKEPQTLAAAEIPSTDPFPTIAIKGMNYYPQKTPWDTFGKTFDPKIIRKDFQLIRNANLNTIRVFVQYEDFGKAEVDVEKLNKLNRLLDIASEEKLKVIVTLFDFYGDYSVLDWTLTNRHAQIIVTKLKDHPAILAWDLKNEPDLDFESRGKEDVLAWLKYTAKTIKQIDHKHAITVGWAKIESAVLLKEDLDFITFHYYEDIRLFEEAYLKLKKEIPNKPLALGEFGMSSYRGFWKPWGSSEQNQADFHKMMQGIFKKNSIQFITWTLYDFESVPKSVVGSLPWRKNVQKSFGFIDNKGRKKKSFAYISN